MFVPAPDQAMLVSGGTTGGAPFHVVTGLGASVLPFVRQVEFIPLSMFESEVSEPCVTRKGIAVNVSRRHGSEGRQWQRVMRRTPM